MRASIHACATPEDDVDVRILGSGGGVPSRTRETSCVLVRDGDSALLLDAGTGVRRLVADATLLAGVRELHVVLTHFHFDHLCGLPYLSWFCDGATIWAPGRWLYSRNSAAILGSLRRPPVAPSDQTDAFPIKELFAGSQTMGPFELRASAQPRHWAPSAGLRVNDELAFVTDTPYEPSSVQLAAGVDHLLHEAWSSSRLPLHPDRDATSADAARVAVEAGAGSLTLIHRNPTLEDHSALLADAAAIFERVALGEDGLRLSREELAGRGRPN
jgi:ribonuclease BN (tRNA processing enzyme)